MEYSIYHIENDLDCRVIKFGVEICIAKANEDTILHLIKGRHKLTFQSIENCLDEYSVIFEVPENGIEDFIDVQLIPIRNKRKSRECRENEQVAKGIECEEVFTQEEIKKSAIEGLQSRLKSALSLYRDFFEKDDKSSIGRIWIKDINDLYYLSYNGMRLTESKFSGEGKFSCGLAKVSERIGDGFKCYYINTDGVQVSDNYITCTPFYKDTALVQKCPGEILRINTKGEVVRKYESNTKLPGEYFMNGILFLSKVIEDKTYELRVVNQLTDEFVYSIRIQLQDNDLPSYSEVDYGYEKEKFRGIIKGFDSKQIKWWASKNGEIILHNCELRSRHICINNSGRIVLGDDMYGGPAY